MKTRITSLFNIRYPLLSAPMSRHSGATLAAAVTNAGGLGLFGALNAGREAWFEAECVKAHALLPGKPWGVGFITHLIPDMPQLFDMALDARVPVLAFSFADPAPYLARAKDAGCLTISQVQTMAQADAAVLAGTDVLVAQGNEAGGHTGQTNLMPFLARVLDAHPDTPTLAAGGISSGRSLAAIIAAGADGAWLGTPLLATHECEEVSDEYKQRLVDASADDTIFTPLYDLVNHKAFGGRPWPDGIAARVLRNNFVNEWQSHPNDIVDDENAMDGYRDELKSGNLDVSVVYAGESVQDITSIRPAGDVIREIGDDAEARLTFSRRN